MLGLHMHMTPHTTPCEWAQERHRLNQTWKCISGLWRFSTTCTWLVKTLYNVLFFFTLTGSLPAFLALFVHWLCCFPFSMSPTVGCIQHSTPQNMYVVEDQPCCPQRLPLSRTSIVPCPPSLGILARQCTTHEFLSVHICTWVQIDIPERDRHVRTYVHMHACMHACTYRRTVWE